MITLLLFSLLLSPTAADPAMAEKVMAGNSPEAIVMPWCQPPPFGTWMVFSDCVMVGSRTAPDDVLVLGGATLTLAAGSELDVDFASHRLLIDVGSRVLVGAGARIH